MITIAFTIYLASTVAASIDAVDISPVTKLNESVKFSLITFT